MGSGAFGRNLRGEIPVPKMKNGRGPIQQKITPWVLGLLGGIFLGKIPGSQNEKWQEPLLQNTNRALGLLGGVYGGDLRFPK